MTEMTDFIIRLVFEKIRDRDRGNSFSEFRGIFHFDGIPIPWPFQSGILGWKIIINYLK